MIRTVWLCILPLMVAGYSRGQSITASQTVSIDGKRQTVRKINGRWWSPDNRQLTPPKDGGFIWTIQSKHPDGVVFFHHRPVDLARAESLQLWMKRDAVRSVLGDPNETFEGSGHWFYYAADGTELAVWFGSNDELLDATYRRPEYGVSGRRVASIERELAGRSVFQLSAQRANQRIAAGRPRTATAPVTVPIPVAADVAPAPASPVVAAAAPPPVKRVAIERLKAIPQGASRDQVIEQLGEPLRSNRIFGSDVEVETLTYAIDPKGETRIRLEGSRVTRVGY